MSTYCDYVRENILAAIYQTVGIELPGMTFSAVKDIVENRPNNIPYEDVLVVNGIKRTWEYVVEEAGNTPLELDTILYYNFLLMEDLMLGAGKLRIQPVIITGTSYVPPMPSEKAVEETIAVIRSEQNPLRQGAKWFAYAAKSQWFRDGNKRTAAMLANHYLMQNDCGLFLLPDTVTRDSQEFVQNLIEYYDSDDIEDFVDWLVDTAIVTI